MALCQASFNLNSYNEYRMKLSDLNDILQIYDFIVITIRNVPFIPRHDENLL